MRILFLLAVLGWNVSFFPANSAAASVPPEEVLAQQLQAGLTQWDKLSRQIKSIEKSLRKLEVLSDPERDDRYWWNPFWRASRESQLQQANKLSLQLQELDNRYRLLEQDLLMPAGQYARQSLENHKTISPEQIMLWDRADAWRIPILLREPAWETITLRATAAQTPELLNRRLHTLRHKAGQWQSLENYLKARLAQIDPAQLEKHQPYSQWQVKLKTNIEKLSKVISALNRKVVF